MFLALSPWSCTIFVHLCEVSVSSVFSTCHLVPHAPPPQCSSSPLLSLSVSRVWQLQPCVVSPVWPLKQTVLCELLLFSAEELKISLTLWGEEILRRKPYRTPSDLVTCDHRESHLLSPCVSIKVHVSRQTGEIIALQL